MSIVVMVMLADLLGLLLAVRLAQRQLGVRGWGLPIDAP